MNRAKKKLIKTYLITCCRGHREIIESTLSATDLIRSRFTDVIGKARATTNGLLFNSPSRGDIHITWVSHAHS